MFAGSLPIGCSIHEPIGVFTAKTFVSHSLRAGQSELRRQQSEISKRHFKTERLPSNKIRHFWNSYLCGSIIQYQNKILRSFHFWANTPFKIRLCLVLATSPYFLTDWLAICLKDGRKPLSLRGRLIKDTNIHMQTIWNSIYWHNIPRGPNLVCWTT